MPEQQKNTSPDQEAGLKQGGDKSATKQQAQTANVEAGKTSVAPVDGKVIRRDRPEGRSAALPNAPQATTFTVVEEDVYEEFYVDNSTRPFYRLLFPRGAVVSQAEYDRYSEQGFEAPAPEVAGDTTQQVVGAEGRVGGTLEDGNQGKGRRG